MKNGYFFTLDVFIALAVIIVGLAIIFSYSPFSPPQSQTAISSQDLMNELASIKISEISTPFVQLLIENKTITNLENSILEQVGEFYVLHQYELARNVSWYTISNFLPPQYGVMLIINDTLIYESQQYSNDSPTLITSKKLISGIINQTIMWGPLKAELRVWRVRGTVVNQSAPAQTFCNYNSVCDSYEQCDCEDCFTESKCKTLISIEFIPPTDPPIVYKNSAFMKMKVTNTTKVDTVKVSWDNVDNITVDSPNLVGLWHLDGDTLDNSRYRNNGRPFNNTNCNAAGYLGKGCEFDGGDYINMSNSATTAIDNWAIEAWIKPASVSPTQTIGFAVYNGDDLRGYGFGIGNPGNELTGLFGGRRWIPTGYNFPFANQWYHVAMTMKAGTLYFYVNGVQKYTDAAGGPNTPNPYLTIGCELDSSHNPNRYFNGTVDEVRIWNRGLSQAEITAMYQTEISGHPFSSPDFTKLVGAWHLDGDAVDSSLYGNHGTASPGANCSKDVQGYLSSACSFNGSSSSYVSVPNVDLKDAFTIEAWVKPVDIIKSQGIFGKPSNFQSTGIQFTLLVSPTAKWDLVFYDSSWNGCDIYFGTATKNVWTHVAVTYNGTRMIGYVNGANALIQPCTPSDIVENAEPYRIGQSNYASSAYYFNGSIDEVRLWSYAKSAQDIADEYQTEVAGHQNYDGYYAKLTDRSYGEHYYYAWANQSDGNSTRTPDRIITMLLPSDLLINYITPPTDISPFTTINPSTRPTFSIQNINPIDTVGLNWNGTDVQIYGRNLLALFNFNNNTNDSSPYNNIVSKDSNAKCYKDTEGHLGTGCHFNMSQYINVSGSGSLNINSSFTLEAWVKPDTFSWVYHTIVSKTKAGSGPGSYNLMLYVRTFYFYVNGPSTGGLGVATTGTIKETQPGNWYYVAGVFNGTNMSVYINGVLQRSRLYPYSGVYEQPAIPVYIGAMRNGDTTPPYLNFNGTIDEVRIWNYSKSAEEIKATYNVEVGKYYINLTHVPNGKYSYYGWVKDMMGNRAQSPTREIEFKPFLNINLVPATEPNKAEVARTLVFVNASISSSGEPLDTVFVNWNGTNVTVDSPALVGLWHMEGTADDSSDYGNDGQIMGDTDCSADGYFGQGCYFDGVDDYIDVGMGNNLNLTSAFTVEAWVKVTNNGDTQRIVARRSNGTNDWTLTNYDLDVDVTNVALIGIVDTNNNIMKATGTSNVADDKWHHLAGIYNGTHLLIYVDGKLEQSAWCWAGLPPKNGNRTTIGADPQNPALNEVKGSIDEVRIWNYSKTPEEIKAGYNAEIGKYYIKQTHLKEGSYSYYAWVNNSIGLTAKSEERNITLYSPLSIAYTSETPANNFKVVASIFSANVSVQHINPIDTVKANWNGTDVLLYSDTLRGLWHFNGNTRDSSRYKNDGTIVGGVDCSYTGYFDKACKFDGVDDYINVPNSDSLEITAPITLEAWINRESMSSSGIAVISKGTMAQKSYALRLMYDSTWKKYYIGYTYNDTITGAGHDYYSMSQTVNANIWNHLAITNDGSLVTVYLNGISLGSAAATGMPVSSTEPVTIAAYTNYYKGLVDEVHIWNYSKTPEEIKAGYNAEVEKYSPSSLSGFWKMEGNALDSSMYGNNGAISGGTDCSVEGEIDKGCYFGGVSGDYIMTANSNSLDITGAFTIESWINTAIGGQGWVVSKFGVDNRGGYGFSTWGGRQIRFTTYCDNSISVCTINGWNDFDTTTANINNSQWHYIALVYNTTHKLIYIDGSSITSRTYTGIIKSNPDGVFIGKSSRNTEPYKGSIDEVKIWKYSKSPGEVKATYDSELRKYRTDYYGMYRVNDQPINKSGNYTYYAWVNDIEGYEALAEMRNVTIAPPFPPMSANFTLPTEETGTTLKAGSYYVNISLSYVPTIIDTFKLSWNGTNVTVDSPTLVGLWHMNGNAMDSSRYKNDGSLHSMTCTATGYLGDACSFSSSYINTSHSNAVDIKGAFTIEAWIKTTASDGWVVSKYGIGNNGGYGFATINAGSQIRFTTHNGGWDDFDSLDAPKINDGQWHHVACVYNKTDKIIYVDSQLSRNKTYSGTITSNPDGVYIGINSNGGGPFTGTIDEVRIWNYSKSTAEIKASYKAELSGHANDPIYYANFINLQPSYQSGYYSYYAWANDSSGAIARTEERDITLSNICPQVAPLSICLASPTPPNGTTDPGGDEVFINLNIFNTTTIKKVTIDWNRQANVTIYGKDLLGLWNFDNNTNDSSQYRNIANKSSTVICRQDTPGYFDSSCNFTTNMQSHINVTGSGSLNIGSNFTIEAWTWLSSNGLGWQIASKYYGGVGTNSFYFGRDVGGKYVLMLCSGTACLSQYSALSKAMAPTGQWVHLAGVYNGTYASLFINGLFNNSATMSVSSIDRVGSKHFEIGAYSAPPINNWNGYIDELRVWNYSKSAAEIRASYNAEIGNTASDGIYFMRQTHLPPGTYTYRARVEDINNNVAYTEERTITLTT